MFRALRLALVAILIAPCAALAQAYPGVTPAPRTTDPATMHALAARRETLERIRLGFEAARRENWSAAEAEFERAVKLAPGEPQASTADYDLGLARAHLGDAGGAAASFESAIARDPGFLAARANLVSVRLAQGNLPAARAAADAFVAAAPGSARALYAQGIVALRAGDASTARDAFRSLTANDPAYAVAHYDLAVAEQQLGRYDDAERELRSALALAPGYARAQIALGAVLLHGGRRDDARAAFDAAARSAREGSLYTLAVSLRDAIGR